MIKIIKKKKANIGTHTHRIAGESATEIEINKWRF